MSDTNIDTNTAIDDAGRIDHLTTTFVNAICFIVILVIVTMFLCWKKGAQNCRINWARAREEMAALIRRQQEQRRAAETKKNPEIRKTVIQKTIVRKTCSAEHSDTDDTAAEESRSDDCSSSSSHSKSIIGVALDTRGGRDDSSTVGENVCSVCLEPFLPDQEVAWSKSLKCRHCFHADCLIPWLMKHDDCPLCRTTIMCDEDFVAADSNSDDGVGDSSNHDIESLCVEEMVVEQPFEIRNGQICCKDDNDGDLYVEGISRFPITIPK